MPAQQQQQQRRDDDDDDEAFLEFQLGAPEPWADEELDSNPWQKPEERRRPTMLPNASTATLTTDGGRFTSGEEASLDAMAASPPARALAKMDDEGDLGMLMLPGVSSAAGPPLSLDPDYPSSSALGGAAAAAAATAAHKPATAASTAAPRTVKPDEQWQFDFEPSDPPLVFDKLTEDAAAKAASATTTTTTTTTTTEATNKDTDDSPPAYDSDSGPGHARTGSHIEYHQDPEGNIEKLHISDDSGLPLEESDHAISDDHWEPMPTVGSYEIYDDKNNLLVEIEQEGDNGTGNAAASGYTRVSNTDDAASITSLDDKTDFLFDQYRPTDEVNSDFQMAATKSMLTEEQRIAYAGLFRLTLAEIANHVRTHGPKAHIEIEALQRWGSKIILKLYSHLGLSNEEQLMIESLATHNLQAEDLTPCLKRLQKVRANGQITSYGTEDVDADELHEDLPKYSEIEKGMEVDVKWTVMCDIFLILLGDGSYDSRSRSALMLIADKLGINTNEVAQFERKVTDVLQIDDSANQDWTEEDIIENRRRKALRKKYAYVGLATVGGGLVIGLSGGLLAPVVGMGLAGALGTIGISGTAGFLAGAGGTALITTASTAVGATVGSRAMLKRAGHVKTFEFRPIFNNNRVNLIITISGWMTGKDDDVRLPFSTIDPIMGDVLSVHWEPEMMRSLGQTINILATEALAFGVQQILAATVLTVLLSALQAPMWLAKLSYLVDNPWSVSLDRAWAAGFILADTLMNRKLGRRPATLVGYGLGARVIYSCLSELARKQQFGLVQDVFLFGTPVFYNKKKFTQARSVVSGRYVNGYSRNDWILAFLFPAAKRYGMVMGLDSIPDKEAEDLQIENIDVSETVDGHMQYRAKMPVLLSQCGWSVLSEEFEEIEDPDPDQLREKQRKLLDELDHAEKPKKSGFFSSWNFDWMQRAKSKTAQINEDETGGNGGEDGSGNGSGSGAVSGSSASDPFLFDIDALRNEMETMKPRMVFEQEPMPLPEHDQRDMPAEFRDLDEEPIKPQNATIYDDPTSPKPTARQFSKQEPAPAAPVDKQPQLHFDDLE